MPRRPATPDEELIGAQHDAVAHEITDATRVERMTTELAMGFRELGGLHRAVSIFGSARTLPGTPEYELAREVGRRLGAAGFAVITGGGPGAMEAANRGAQDAGAQSIGLDIELPHEQALNDHVDPGLGLTLHYFFTRKVLFVRYASAFVCFPGGFGTLDELFEVLTLRQTGKIAAFPIVLVGKDYWRGLIEWLIDPVCREGKIAPEDVDRITWTDDLDEVVRIVEAAEHRRPRRQPT
jgi:uncharacterized protein (TIGR00730 family)